MNFGITNLTDEKYWVYQSSTAASSMPYEMGRSYYVTLSGSF
jgi:outer membrane receptor protein involved in Fe transport